MNHVKICYHSLQSISVNPVDFRVGIVEGSWAMFPLSCARAHTGRETGRTKNVERTLLTFPPKILFVGLCISYTSFQIQISGKLLHTGNFMRTQTLKNLKEH